MMRLLSAGAAKGLVTALQPAFTAAGGPAVDGIFSAVGAIRDRFVAGDPCDVLILTARQLAALAAEGRLDGAPTPIGTVRTAVAVPAGHPAPAIADANGLAQALAAATAVYVPDPYLSTAGIHVLGVVDALGLADAVTPKLRAFPNGETAMRHLSVDRLPGSLGSTQVTEILNTPGLTLAGPLPGEHGLSTVYAAAVSRAAADKAAARALVELLTGPSGAAARLAAGFA